ncbi:hypothetical protein PRSY57_1332500 [Plasmodium reichenowi]|uniref:Uncharacterized protein n=1 Tax=Plasmodium reichenowi TaxID=5854 RepID=A0A151L752_PLARE|nr:hypothetical protein PRSY57_1332500 [Plasmodium reichenowi]KYN94769.1 hypothetical protein PRSY57_1332500 [Plasmodium reichenowi]
MNLINKGFTYNIFHHKWLLKRCNCRGIASYKNIEESLYNIKEKKKHVNILSLVISNNNLCYCLLKNQIIKKIGLINIKKDIYSYEENDFMRNKVDYTLATQERSEEKQKQQNRKVEKTKILERQKKNLRYNCEKEENPLSFNIKEILTMLNFIKLYSNGKGHTENERDENNNVQHDIKNDHLKYDDKNNNVQHDIKNDHLKYDHENNNVQYDIKKDHLKYDHENNNVQYDIKNDHLKYDHENNNVQYDIKNDHLKYDHENNNVQYDIKNDHLKYDDKSNNLQHDIKNHHLQYDDKNQNFFHISKCSIKKDSENNLPEQIRQNMKNIEKKTYDEKSEKKEEWIIGIEKVNDKYEKNKLKEKILSIIVYFLQSIFDCKILFFCPKEARNHFSNKCNYELNSREETYKYIKNKIKNFPCIQNDDNNINCLFSDSYVISFYTYRYYMYELVKNNRTIFNYLEKQVRKNKNFHYILQTLQKTKNKKNKTDLTDLLKDKINKIIDVETYKLVDKFMF